MEGSSVPIDCRGEIDDSARTCDGTGLVAAIVRAPEVSNDVRVLLEAPERVLRPWYDLSVREIQAEIVQVFGATFRSVNGRFYMVSF